VRHQLWDLQHELGYSRWILLLLPDTERSYSWDCAMNPPKPPDRLKAVEPHVVAPPEAEPILSNRIFDFKKILETLASVKNFATLIAFFGAAVIWTIHYYATHEELDTLECYTKLNVRMLQSKEDEYYDEQIKKEGHRELLDQQHFLKKIESDTHIDQDDVQSINMAIDRLKDQEASFLASINEAKRASQRALTLQTQNVCQIKEQRDKILDELKLGKF